MFATVSSTLTLSTRRLAVPRVGTKAGAVPLTLSSSSSSGLSSSSSSSLALSKWSNHPGHSMLPSRPLSSLRTALPSKPSTFSTAKSGPSHSLDRRPHSPSSIQNRSIPMHETRHLFSSTSPQQSPRRSLHLSTLQQQQSQQRPSSFLINHTSSKAQPVSCTSPSSSFLAPATRARPYTSSTPKASSSAQSVTAASVSASTSSTVGGGSATMVGGGGATKANPLAYHQEMTRVRFSFDWWKEWTIIMGVFAVTGSSTVMVVRPVLKEVLQLEGTMKDGPWSYRVGYLCTTLPLYSCILLTVATVAGRRPYFKVVVLRMWGRFLPKKVVQRFQ